MRIGYATSDWSHSYRDANGVPSLGGAGWYRVGLPARALGARPDHKTVVGVLVELDGVLGVAEWDEDGKPGEVRHFDCDVVVIQRYMNDDLPKAVQRAVATGQVIINDVDDWFWGLDTSNRAFLHSHPKFNPTSNLDHYRKTLAASSMITTSTPYLAKRLQEMFPAVPIEVVRNAIDLDRFAADKPSALVPNIGWVGAQPWRSGDLETLRGVVGPWCARNDWGFHHGGDVSNAENSAATLMDLPESVPFSTEPMCPIDDYPALFGHIDVGIVPLRYCPFNEAKSGIKGMEYAASGVPFIAAATEEYRWLTGTMKIGRLARRPKDWIRHFDVLRDPEARKVDAAHNREAVERLSIDTQWINWQDAYRDAVKAAK